MFCQNCNSSFPRRVVIKGKVRFLRNRKYCLVCSPFGKYNTRPLPCIVYTSRKKRAVVYNRSRRDLIKKKMVETKGGKCQKCGYSRCIKALEFHHRNKASKMFSLSLAYSKNWKIVLKELRKCDMLCSNCHAEVEAGIL